MNIDKLISRINDWKEHSDVGTQCPIFCDIDHTLLLWNAEGDDFEPNQELIELFKKYNGDIELTLWSARGAEYCRGVAEALGITDLVNNYLGKPAIVIDDIEVNSLMMLHMFPE